jgi:hypothetical protein
VGAIGGGFCSPLCRLCASLMTPRSLFGDCFGRVDSKSVTGPRVNRFMTRKQISKTPGTVSIALKNLRELGYLSVACASVLGALMLLAPAARTPHDNSPPPPVTKKHR